MEKARCDRECQAVLEYCKRNCSMLDRMTTPDIAKHLKQQFPELPVMTIVEALGRWCTEHRPKIAG